MATTDDNSQRSTDRLRGLAATALVIVGLWGFFAAMIGLEPLTGDGWYNADDIKQGATLDSIVRSLRHLHHHGNPRIGQVFTILTYAAPTFHQLVTPLLLLSLIVLTFVHAAGRLPRVTEQDDAWLVAFAAAALYLAVPQPGHAFFYRPITTNYVYSHTLTLLFFLPYRLGFAPKNALVAGLSGVVALGFGLFVGKTNEHTGPTAIVVAACAVAVAVRRRELLQLLFRVPALLGLVVGYLFLFFAPGQEERYGALGRQSVLETILGRGIVGTADLLGEFVGYIGPLVLALALLMLLAALLDGVLPKPPCATLRTIGLYTGLAILVLGTTLAAPKNHYRLFVAPAILLSIATVATVRGLWASAWVRRGTHACSGFVHATFMAIFLPLFSDLHADEAARVALIRAANPEQTIVVPRLRHAKRTPYFYGDSITVDPRHRDRMQSLYGVTDIRVEKAPGTLTEPSPKTKAKAKAKPKATSKPKLRRPAPPPSEAPAD